MLQHPAVFGIDSRRIASQAQDVTTQLALFGKNTGNLLFSEALFRALAGARRCTYRLSAEDRAQCDVIVLAAANWVNHYDDFAWLANELEHLNLPVVVVGLGAQAGTDRAIPKLQPGTLRLLQIAAERSPHISVRGAFTADVLEHYGVKNSVVTGCPSLLLAGQGVQMAPALVTDDWDWSECSLHATRNAFYTANSMQTALYRFAMKYDSELVLQSETAELCLMWPGADAEMMAQAESVLPKVYNCSFEQVRDYVTRRGRAYRSTDEWIEALRTRRFCLGTRIHGTIAALLAGINAVLLTHDSRTEEMAAAMNVPAVSMQNVDWSKDLDIREFYSAGAMALFAAGYSRYREEFLAFFRKVGLTVNAEHFGMSAEGAPQGGRTQAQ